MVILLPFFSKFSISLQLDTFILDIKKNGMVAKPFKTLNKRPSWSCRFPPQRGRKDGRKQLYVWDALLEIIALRGYIPLYTLYS